MAPEPEDSDCKESADDLREYVGAPEEAETDRELFALVKVAQAKGNRCLVLGTPEDGDRDAH